MLKDDLNKILKQHKIWMDLSGVESMRADLGGTNLGETNLGGTDLGGTDLDSACWPLWCGSFDAIVDDRLVAQLIAHVPRLDVSNCSGGVQEVH